MHTWLIILWLATGTGDSAPTLSLSLWHSHQKSEIAGTSGSTKWCLVTAKKKLSNCIRKEQKGISYIVAKELNKCYQLSANNQTWCPHLYSAGKKHKHMLTTSSSKWQYIRLYLWSNQRTQLYVLFFASSHTQSAYTSHSYVTKHIMH